MKINKIVNEFSKNREMLFMIISEDFIEVIKSKNNTFDFYCAVDNCEIGIDFSNNQEWQVHYSPLSDVKNSEDTIISTSSPFVVINEVIWDYICDQYIKVLNGYIEHSYV